MTSKDSRKKLPGKRLRREQHPQSDFSSSFFPDFQFEFSHKAPSTPSTRVSYDATYRHWDETTGLRLFRHILHDSSRKTGGSEDWEQDKRDRETMTADERIEKCYSRCQQPKNATGKCNVCWEEDEPLGGFEGDAAWKIFWRHATFSEIVEPSSRTRLEPPLYLLYQFDPPERRERSEFLPDNPCVDHHPFSLRRCPHKRCPHRKDTYEPIASCQLLSDYFKKWLQAWRDNQDYLLPARKGVPDEAVQILVRVLYAARWHPDREDREKARDLLLGNLIPGHNKTGLLPHKKRLIPMKALLVKLARELSKKCKDEYLTFVETGDFDELIEWSSKNDLRIFNIASESKKSIMQLVTKPADYANSFLAKRYGISIRTLKEAFKSSVANIHSY